jgi:DNA replication protein DnaC
MPHWRVPTPEDYDWLNGLDSSVCETCGGLGHVETQRGYRPCPNQSCEAGRSARNELAERMNRISKVPPRYANATLDDFDLEQIQQGKTLVYKTCRMLASRLSVAPKELSPGWKHGDEPRNWVMISGTLGTGKTHAGCAVVNYINRYHGIPARYIRLDDLFAEVRESYEHDTDESTSVVLDRFKNQSFLMIDEMNITRPSEHSAGILESILRHRYAHTLPTLMTTNLDVKSFEEMWGSRIASVVYDCVFWVRMEGYNLRYSGLSVGDSDE